MRLMNWNIEHMNSWWESDDAESATMRLAFRGNRFSPAITDVPALAKRVGAVINAVDPDIITIQEGAGIPEMNDFFNRFVEGSTWRVLRGSGGGQALVVAARLDRCISGIDNGPETIGNIDLSEPFEADVNADLHIEATEFARQPQVVEFTAHGQRLLLMNNHLKSKYVHDARARFEAGGDTRRAFFQDALIARRRISAEAFRIREYLNGVFDAEPMRHVIVAGDLNDGPGADYFERNFLTHSVVDRVFGSVFQPERQLAHALFHGGATDYTAQFYDYIEGRTRDLVLDHVGLSRGINRNFHWRARVGVSEYEAQVLNDSKLKERDRSPSDHRPVVVDLTPRDP